MSKAMIRKKTQILVLAMMMLVILTASSAFAVTQFIDKDKGGIISIDRGIYLTIMPKSLNEDTLISATISDEGSRLYFYFGPDDTVFAKNRPAILFITNDAIEQYGLDNFVLYGEDGETQLSYNTRWGKMWSIHHFSLYYFVRR
jgi:hypothetical protein